MTWLDLLVAEYAPGGGPYLCLQGEKTASDLPAELQNRGIPVRSAIIYRQVETPLSDKARVLIATQNVIVPLFSANSAEVFARQAAPLKPRRLCFVCISQNAAAPVRGLATPDAVRIAENPSRAAMIEALRQSIRPE